MSIAAFILSLLGGILALFQGGCACIGGGALHEYSRAAGRVGAGGFLIVIAAVTGFVGGAMAFTRKAKAKIILGASTGLCLLAVITGFTDGIIYCLIYGIAAVLAHLDTTKQSASNETNSQPVAININFDFHINFQWLKDFIAYVRKYPEITSLVTVALPFHIYNPVFWLGCFLKYKKHKYADKVLFAGILFLLIQAGFIMLMLDSFFPRFSTMEVFRMREDLENLLPSMFYIMAGVNYDYDRWIFLFMLGLQVLLIYSVGKTLDGDNRFKWPAYISCGILAVSFNSLGVNSFNHKHYYILCIICYISVISAIFTIYSLMYLPKNRNVAKVSQPASKNAVEKNISPSVGQPVRKKTASPENIVSAPAKTKKAESIQDMSKRGFDLLKASDFNQANQIFDQILAKNPKSAGAYVGKLMSILKAKNANELVALPIRLEEEELFQKAMTYSTPKMKELLSKYIQANNAKNSRRQKKQ